MMEQQGQESPAEENYDGGSTYGEQDPEFIRLQIDVEKDLDRFTQEVLRGMVEVVDAEKGTKKWERIGDILPFWYYTYVIVRGKIIIYYNALFGFSIKFDLT